jgi:hypothetical protein
LPAKRVAQAGMVGAGDSESHDAALHLAEIGERHAF